MIAQKLGYPQYPDCPIPLAFYPVVNIALMWFGSPLAAYLSRRNVLLGLSFWGLIFANGLVHTVGGIMAGAYNTGLWTAAFLFIPLSIWVLYAIRDSRAVQRQGRGRVVRRRSPHACLPFRRLRALQGRGDWQYGPAGLCRRDRFHAAHPGGHCVPVLQA